MVGLSLVGALGHVQRGGGRREQVFVLHTSQVGVPRRREFRSISDLPLRQLKRSKEDPPRGMPFGGFYVPKTPPMNNVFASAKLLGTLRAIPMAHGASRKPQIQKTHRKRP